MTEHEKCVTLLERNGWSANHDKFNDTDYLQLFKDECTGVDINKEEIVFISGQGDFLHLPLNYFALVGALFEHRQISANYKQV